MSAPRAYKTRAVVLRARNLGEADRVVTLFTLERGKIDAVAKGVRRARSHFAGRLEFMNEVLLSMHRGRTLDVIVTAEIDRTQWEAIVQPPAFSAANIVGEAIDAFCEPDLALPEVYSLLTGVVRAIARSDDPMTLLPRFSLRLLDALGLAPPPTTCVQCGASLLGRGAWLDGEHGGLAGEECRVAWREVLELDAEDVANFARLGARAGGTVAPALHATPRVAKAVELLLSHQIGWRPKAGLHAREFVQP